MLWRGDRRDRIELQEAEPANGAQHVGRRAVEELRAHRDPPRLLDARLPRLHAVRSTRSSPRTRASRAAAGSSFASTLPRTFGSGVNRRIRSTPSRAVGLEVGAAEEPVAGEQRQHVVAVDALVLALVDLDHVPEAEEALEQRPVPDEVVERADEHRRRGVAVELDLRQDVERRPAVVDRRPRAAAPLRRARAGDGAGAPCRPSAASARGSPARSARREPRRRAGRASAASRPRAGSARRAIAAGSRARPGRRRAGSSAARRSRAHPCPRALRAPSSTASSSTCRRGPAPRSRARPAAPRRGSARAPARRDRRAPAARGRGRPSDREPSITVRKCGQSSIGSSDASCAQYSKMRPERSRAGTVSRG